ncbi:MAG TPA: GNAT family N-acetyltransferase [Bacteroidota bacterium]|nr:GNAT family N-acetyltransferase [Bacteroidota bacterium]
MQTVTSEAEFDRLETEWNELIENADVHVFQTFEWLRTWWEFFKGPRDRLHVILFSLDGKLVGIVPLYEKRAIFFGIVRFQFIGRGLSDYLNLIIRTGCEHLVLQEFGSYLHAHRHEWTLCDIESVNERSTLMLQSPGVFEKSGLKVHCYQASISLSVGLPDSEEKLMTMMGETSRHNYKRKLKSFQQKFNGRLEVVQVESNELAGALEIFARVHGARWKSLGYPSAFDDPRHLEFHARFSEKFARRGWLRMLILRAKDEPVAVSYGFNFNKRIYLYQCNAIASREVMQCSPGIIIRVLTAADGVRSGMKILDYLRGGEQYKGREWETQSDHNYFLRITCPSGRKYWSFFPFIVGELLLKGKKRFQEEYYEYRRFKRSKPHTFRGQLSYIGDKTKTLFGLGLKFIVHNVPGFRPVKVELTDAKRDKNGTADRAEKPDLPEGPADTTAV